MLLLLGDAQRHRGHRLLRRRVLRPRPLQDLRTAPNGSAITLGRGLSACPRPATARPPARQHSIVYLINRVGYRAVQQARPSASPESPAWCRGPGSSGGGAPGRRPGRRTPISALYPRHRCPRLAGKVVCGEGVAQPARAPPPGSCSSGRARGAAWRRSRRTTPAPRPPSSPAAATALQRCSPTWPAGPATPRENSRKKHRGVVQGLRSHRAAAVVELEDGLALADGLGGLRALVGALDPDLGFGRSAVSETEASSISVDLGYN